MRSAFAWPLGVTRIKESYLTKISPPWHAIDSTDKRLVPKPFP
jgi:hypothetical protein